MVSVRAYGRYHVAAFGSVFSTQEQVKLSYVKYLPMPQNDLVSLGQTQPRYHNLTSRKLSGSPLLMPEEQGLAIYNNNG